MARSPDRADVDHDADIGRLGSEVFTCARADDGFYYLIGADGRFWRQHDRVRLVVDGGQQALDAAIDAAASLTPFEVRLYLATFEGIRRRIAELRLHGTDLNALGDPVQLADYLVAAAPLEPSPLADLTGPFYDTSSLRKWLDISRQALAERAHAKTLLALKTGDGSIVYPAWQFTPDRATIPHLAEVLRILGDGINDPWTWALWLSAPDEDLDNLSSAQWLAAGRDPDPVLAEARADAARWAA